MINKSKIIKDAQKFVAKAQWDKAIAEYGKILADSPGDANTHNTVGDLYLKKNDSDRAIESYKKAADLFNKSGFTLKAIALYKKVLNIKPDQIDIMLLMGRMNAERGMLGNANESYLAAAAYFTRQGQRSKAIDVYKTLCDLNPDNHSLTVKLAELYISEGHEREGISKYIELAEKKIASNDLSEAQNFLDKISQKGADRFDFIRVSAVLDLKSGRPQKALNRLEGLSKTDPHDVRVIALLGEAYSGSGIYEKSAAQYARLLEKEPGNIHYRQHLLDAYLKSGDYGSAWDEYKTLVEAHISRNEHEEAKKLLNEFLEHKPDSIEARQQLAVICTKTGHEGETARLHREMADLYFAAGETEKASNIYRKLLEKNPDDESIKAKLSQLNEPEKAPAPQPEQTEEALAPQPVQAEEALVPQPEEPEAESPAPAATEEITEPSGEPAGKVYELPEEPAELPPLDLESEEEEGYLPAPDGNVVELDSGELKDLDIFGAEEEEPEPESEPVGTQAAPVAEMQEVSGVIPEEKTPVSVEPSLTDRLAEIDVYIRYGLTDRAMTTLSELEKSIPASHEIKKRRIEVCKSLGDVDGFVDTSSELARIYMDMGQAGEAEKVIRKALEIDPGDARLTDMLSELCPAAESVPAEAGTPEAAVGLPEVPYEEHEMHIPTIDVFAQADTAPSMAPGSVHYIEEMAEADFYAQQGLAEEARLIYRRLLEVNPDDPALKSKLEALGSPEEEPAVAPETALAPVDSVPAEEEAVEEIAPSGALDEAGDLRMDRELDTAFTEVNLEEEISPEPGEDFFDLVAELKDELDETEPLSHEPPETFQDKHLEEVFQEFKKGVEEQLNKEDYETHYNLGIAYKEMGMLDEAISEFNLAAKDPPRGLDCASMRGLCYLEKGEYDEAIRQFRTGLEISGHEKGEYMGLKYDLATAYELKGDTASAQVVVNELCKADAGFRDVKERLQRLNKALLEAGVQPEKPAPNEPAPSPKTKKNKVSYL